MNSLFLFDANGPLFDVHGPPLLFLLYWIEHQELLELEEASLLKKKLHLQEETLAVEELLDGLAEAEGKIDMH